MPEGLASTTLMSFAESTLSRALPGAGEPLYRIVVLTPCLAAAAARAGVSALKPMIACVRSPCRLALGASFENVGGSAACVPMQPEKTIRSARRDRRRTATVYLA
jgi:hypothetical protein